MIQLVGFRSGILSNGSSFYASRRIFVNKDRFLGNFYAGNRQNDPQLTIPRREKETVRKLEERKSASKMFRPRRKTPKSPSICFRLPLHCFGYVLGKTLCALQRTRCSQTATNAPPRFALCVIFAGKWCSGATAKHLKGPPCDYTQAIV